MRLARLLILLLAAAPVFSQTRINMATQDKPPGSNSQLLYNNNGSVGAEDPIISYAYVNLLSAAAATATQTSSVVRVPTLGGFGTIYVTLASLSGSYTSCTAQMKNADSLGNLINNGSAIALTMSNGVASYAVPPSAALQTTAQEQVVYACSAYGSAGTISIDFAPGIGVAVLNTPPWAVSCTAANCAVNLAQVAGTTTSTGNGTSNAGDQRMNVASDNSAVPSWGQGATGSAVPSGAVYQGGNGGGNLTGHVVCDHTYVNNGLATSGSTQAVAASGSTTVYICDLFVNTASTTAVNVKLVYGTGTNCATSPADLSLLIPMVATATGSPAGQSVGPPANILWKTTASQAVCVNLSSANAINVMFHYTQF